MISLAGKTEMTDWVECNGELTTGRACALLDREISLDIHTGACRRSGKDPNHEALLARRWVGVVLVGGGRGAAGRAQFGYQRPQTNPYGAPAVSPYLNMLRPGANPCSNYYGLVKPQMNTNQSIQQLQQYTFGINSATQPNTDEANRQSTTGHAVQFFNYGSYFPMAGAGRTGGLGGLGGQTQAYKRAGR